MTEDRTLSFLASFNRIDAELRHQTGLDHTVDFRHSYRFSGWIPAAAAAA
jgi:hypothetical protein